MSRVVRCGLIQCGNAISTDESVEIVAEAVEHWRAQGIDISCLHRTNRTGFKAGALAEGLQSLLDVVAA